MGGNSGCMYMRFLGATPAHLYPRLAGCPDGPRRIEVEAFLTNILNDPDRPWFAVDDTPVLYGACERVPYSAPSTGLCIADVAALIKALKALSLRA